MKTKVAPRSKSSRAAMLRRRRISTEPAGARAPSAIRPEKILVPVDFSAESTMALDYAAALATRCGAAITLLHVVEPIHYVCDYGYGPVTRERSNETVIKSVRAHLRRLARRHLADNPYAAVVRSGTAFSEITAAAKELDVDLILIPTRGLTDSKDVLLGSTAERVVRHAACPVLTLRKPALSRILKP